VSLITSSVSIVSIVLVVIFSSSSIIFGSDGLWEKVGDEVVCDIVRTIKDPVNAVVALRDKAAEVGSEDNVSIIVIQLRKDPKIIEEEEKNNY